MNRHNTQERHKYISTAPGRVNLLGEHVDYNEGPVLPLAIDRHVQVRATPVSDDVLILHAHDFSQEVSIHLSDLEKKCTLGGEPLPGWAYYPAGVAWALQQQGLMVKGLRAVIDSNLPIGAGLSSSAALQMAFAVLWQLLGGWHVDRMMLARICLQAEVDYVGLKCGLMDQFTAAHGVDDHVLFFDTRSLDWDAIPLPNIALVIAYSKVSHTLADSSYNDRQEACQQALRMLKVHLPEIKALRDVSVSELKKYENNLPIDLRKRARHVVEECARVFQAVQYLRSGDADSLGKLMFEGHASLRDLYEVSCPELDTLVEIAGRLPGCKGSRLTGAGFGGSTINLVEYGAVDQFIFSLKEQYQHEFGLNAEVFATRAGRGAWVQSLTE